MLITFPIQSPITQLPVSIHIPSLSTPTNAIHYYSYIWPSSLILSLYLCIFPLNDYYSIIELGAGTCLPSLLITELTNNDHYVIATDIHISCMSITQQQQQQQQFNDKNNNLILTSLIWGDSASIDSFLYHYFNHKSIDLVIGSDILFHHDVFDQVLATFDRFIHHNKSIYSLSSPRLMIAYQRRSSSHSLLPYLEQWNMIIEQQINATTIMNKLLQQPLSNPNHELARQRWTQSVHDQPMIWNRSGLTSVDIIIIRSNSY